MGGHVGMRANGQPPFSSAKQEGFELPPDDFVTKRLLGLAAFVLDGEGPSGPKPEDEVTTRKLPAGRRSGQWCTGVRGAAGQQSRGYGVIAIDLRVVVKLSR